MKERKIGLGELAQLPTPRLDELLQNELRKEQPDSEVVLEIIRIFQEREADYPVTITRDVSIAWEKYEKSITPLRKQPRRHGWIAAVAAAAAVLCIVILAMPRSVEAKGVLGVLFRFSESVFEFFTPEQDATDPPVEYVFQTDHPGLQQLYDTVTEQGVTASVVPTWVPEEFVLTELKMEEMSDGNKVLAKLESESNVVIVTYRISADISTKFEKEDTTVELYEVAGVGHVILKNDNNFSATWIVDGAECSISADLDKGQLYKVIDSIYKGKSL